MALGPRGRKPRWSREDKRAVDHSSSSSSSCRIRQDQVLEINRSATHHNSRWYSAPKFHFHSYTARIYYGRPTRFNSTIFWMDSPLPDDDDSWRPPLTGISLSLSASAFIRNFILISGRCLCPSTLPRRIQVYEIPLRGHDRWFRL